MKMLDSSKIINGLIACLLSILVFLATELNDKIDAQAERLRGLELSQAEVVATLKLRPLGQALSAEKPLKQAVLVAKK